MTPLDEQSKIGSDGMRLTAQYAKYFSKYSKGLNIDRDDLIGVGLLAYCEAMHSVDDSFTVPFICYARMKIKFAIKQFLRTV